MDDSLTTQDYKVNPSYNIVSTLVPIDAPIVNLGLGKGSNSQAAYTLLFLSINTIQRFIGISRLVSTPSPTYGGVFEEENNI